MNKVFYGICNSSADESEKAVIISDIELLAEDFVFEKGDLLTVFFANENTENSPTLVLYVNDTESEISTTIDEGKYIKSHDVEAELSNAWGAGETVIFAYTQQGTSNIYYWELVDAVHASHQIYGVTRLFDDDITDQDFSDWIKSDPEETDSNIALTPNALKRLYNLLSGQTTNQPNDSGGSEEPSPEDPIEPDPEEPEPEPVEPLIGLTWTPAPEMAEYETDNLGTLSLTGDSNGIDITYPIQALIDSRMGSTGMPTHTGQLVNNGNGPDTQESNPFITKIVPDNLYFANSRGLYYTTGTNSIPRIILNDNSNRIAIGSDSDNTLSSVYIAKPLTIKGKTIVSTGGIAVTGASTISGGLTVTGDGKATTLYENNVSLVNKYSKKLKVVKFNQKTGTISKNASCGHKHITITQSGWTPLGVVGYNVNYNNANSTGDSKYANVWECYLMNNTTVEYSIYNVKSSAINVQIDVYVLYVAN